MFKRMLDSSRYASSRAKSGAYGMTRYGPGTAGAGKASRSAVTTGTRSSIRHVARGSPAGLSEESILPQSITKTTVVTIDRRGADGRAPAAAYVDGWAYPEHRASETV